MIEATRWARPAAAALVLLIGACASGSGEDLPGGRDRGVLVIRGDGPAVRIEVEIADTPEEKVRGLMGRESLPPNAGMVFVEEEPSTGGFWMKDTLIPLSIAFWGKNERIFRILDMAPCTEESCPTYSPDGEWIGAVEVNQGFFEENGVEVGDRVALVAPALQ